MPNKKIITNYNMFNTTYYNTYILNILNKYLFSFFLISYFIFKCSKISTPAICYISDNKDIIDPLIYLALSPELFLIGLIIYFLLFISLFNKYNQNVLFIKSMIMFLIIFLLVELKLLFVLYSYDLQFSYLNDQFIINNFVLFIKIILIIVTIFFFLSMYDNVDNENYLNIELPIIILISLVGMFILVSANDLFIMYLALELQSLALYIICAIKRYSNLSIEAGLKYFILGSFSSAILLLGISLIYGLLGTTNYYELSTCLYPEFLYTNIKGIYFSMGCIFIGLLFKLGIVPFHLWIADVFEGSPNIITYFFAVVPKIAILFVFYRLFFVVFINSLTIFSFFISICAIFSIFVGSVLALYQIKIKRFFAYSAIVHMGYILLTMSLGSYLSVYVAFYYLFIYILVSLNIFTIYLVIYRQDNSPLKNIVDGISVLHSNFFLAFLFVIALLSVAGIPPLAGFFGKLYVFSLLMETGNYFMALYVVLMSVLSAAYYIRFVRFILFTEIINEQPITFIITITELQAYLISFLFIINISFIFFQGPILILFDNIFLNQIVCLS